MMKKFALEQQGLISRLMFLEQLVYLGQGFLILVLVDHFLNGTQGDFFLERGPILGIDQIGDANPKNRMQCSGPTAPQ